MRLKRLTACVLAGAMALSMALTGCGTTINKAAEGATLNGEQIPLGFMNFMARYQQAIGDLNYMAYFGKDMWKSEISDGVTMEDDMKQGIVDSIETMYLLEDHMADYGVELTGDELSSMDEAAKKFMSDNSTKAIKQLGATEEYVKEMLRLNTIQKKMQTAIYDASKAEVTEEEAKQRTFSYIKESAKTTKDGEGNSVDLTEEEQKEVASKMKDIAKSAKKNFEGTAQENSYEISTYSYGADESTMDEAVIKAADALKEGEVSKLITTEEDYYIIRLDSEYDKEKTEAKKVTLLNKKKSEEFTKICDGYKEGAEFKLNEAQWAKVKFDRLFSAVPAETDKTEK